MYYTTEFLRRENEDYYDLAEYMHHMGKPYKPPFKHRPNVYWYNRHLEVESEVFSSALVL